MRSTMKVLDSGKVTVPAQIREALGLEQGDLVEADFRPVNANATVVG